MIYRSVRAFLQRWSSFLVVALLLLMSAARMVFRTAWRCATWLRAFASGFEFGWRFEEKMLPRRKALPPAEAGTTLPLAPIQAGKSPAPLGEKGE